MQPQIRLVRLVYALGDHLAVIIAVEAIHDDALEPGHAFHLTYDNIAQLRCRVRVLHGGQSVTQRVMRVALERRSDDRFDLQHRHTVVAVNDEVEGPSRNLGAQGIALVPSILG